MSADKQNLVQVEIFGQIYSLKGGSDPRQVEEAAAYVDAQMSDVSRAAGAVDTVRIAVLAALNIADELFRARRSAEAVGENAGRRAADLARQLESALDEGARKG